MADNERKERGGDSTRRGRSARSRATRSALPPAGKPAPCACGGGCPRCRGEGEPLPSTLRSKMESTQHTDFSDVRMHPDAADVTTPLAARAVTQGQDIFFHPGLFQPHTPEGQALIAHELAHTRQSGAADSGVAGSVSKPGDALERNADALAQGRTSHALSAPAGAALRSPFDNETADERTRRLALLDSIDNARDHLLRLLSTGGLLDNVEAPVERNGVRGIIYGAHTAGTADEEFVSYTDRDQRIRRIIRSLMAMGRLYRGAPVPVDFTPPVQDTVTGEFQSTVTYPAGSAISSSSYGGSTQEWADLQAAYERYRISRNQTGDAYESDWYYIDPTVRINTGAARGAPRTRGGINSGAYCVFPDIDNDPLNYHLLDGFTRVPRGATIVDLLHDDFGYYYIRHDRRIDVRNPWR